MTELIKNFIQQAQNPLLVIVGPTASGKSNLAINIAQKYNGEIISADSRQIYKYMDIGTAKIKKTEQLGIPHYMIDIINPDQDFSVAEYKNTVINTIKKIHSRNNLPIIAGGTGLYIDAVINNYDIPKKSHDSNLRTQLINEYENKGSEKMHQRLKLLDPVAALKIHPNNKHHLIRALEVVINDGQSKFKIAKTGNNLFETLLLGIHIEREKLYDRINQRVIQMFQDGLISETKKLLRIGYKKDLPSMSSIGYREVIQFLNDEISEQKAISVIQQKTRNYAKRQITWWRKNKEIKWITNT